MSRLMNDLRDAVASVKDHYAGKITLRTSKVPKLRAIAMPPMTKPWKSIANKSPPERVANLRARARVVATRSVRKIHGRPGGSKHTPRNRGQE